jgi:hypothetical protein
VLANLEMLRECLLRQAASKDDAFQAVVVTTLLRQA